MGIDAPTRLKTTYVPRPDGAVGRQPLAAATSRAAPTPEQTLATADGSPPGPLSPVWLVA